MAVSLSVANHAASLPVAYRLYLPQQWVHDSERRAKAGVPEEAGLATKPEIALDQIRAALAAGIASGAVLMDAGYGADTGLRSEISALGLGYVASILPHTTVWPHGRGPLPPKAWSGRGRPTSRMRRDGAHQPVQVGALALALPEEAWRTITRTWPLPTWSISPSRAGAIRTRLS